MGEGLLVGAWVTLKQRNRRAGIQNEQWLCRWNSSQWTSPSLESSSSGRLVSIWGGTAHKWQGEMARHSGEWPPPILLWGNVLRQHAWLWWFYEDDGGSPARAEGSAVQHKYLGPLFVDMLGEHHVCRDTMLTFRGCCIHKGECLGQQEGTLGKEVFWELLSGSHHTLGQKQ